MTNQAFKSIQKIPLQSKTFSTEVHLLIKYNCQGTQWYVFNTISVLRACMVQAERYTKDQLTK